MNLFDVFSMAQKSGLSIRSKDSSLIVKPMAMLTAELSGLIREHKVAIVSALERSADLDTCSECDGPLLAIPTFDGFENFECLSCDRCTGCRKVAQ